MFVYVVSQRIEAIGSKGQRIIASWDGVSSDDYLLNSGHIMSRINSKGDPITYNKEIRSYKVSVATRSLKNVYIGL